MKFQLERIILFSDAVFAIAITLMMIEIKPPHLLPSDSFELSFIKLMELLPVFVGVVLSFFLIGFFWKKHHELMKHAAAYDQKMVGLNFGFLLSIAFIPFSTSFVFENLEAQSPLPMVVYNLNYIIATILNYRLFMHVLHPEKGLRSEGFNEDLRALKRELLFPLLVYLLVMVLAFVSPNFAGMGYGVFAFENLWQRKRKKTAVAMTPAPEPVEN